MAEGPATEVVSLPGAGRGRRSGSLLPHPRLPTWGRRPQAVRAGVWVPRGKGGWEPCGCWRWPSPAAGGRRAARVRPCGAASAVPRPETLRARASATSSSTVGAGAGSGMQARGPSPRGAPPHLACGGLEPAAATRGTAPSPTWTSRVAGSPPPTAAAGIVGCVNASPAVAAPRSAPSPTGDCILHLKHRFPHPPRTNESTEDFLCCIFPDASLKGASFAHSCLSLIICTKALYLCLHLSSRT